MISTYIMVEKEAGVQCHLLIEEQTICNNIANTHALLSLFWWGFVHLWPFL
jgi:hypothetical protein